MIFILSSPFSRPCDVCGVDGDAWHVVMDFEEGGFASQLCTADLARFLDDWTRDGLRAASERVPGKRTVKPE